MDSMDSASQLAAKQAECESLKCDLLKVQTECQNYRKAFQELSKKYEDLLNQLGATDA